MLLVPHFDCHSCENRFAENRWSHSMTLPVFTCFISIMTNWAPLIGSCMSTARESWKFFLINAACVFKYLQSALVERLLIERIKMWQSCYNSNLHSLVHALDINQFFKWHAAPSSPSDSAVKKVADKLASFVAKNGRQFEHVTRQRNPGDTPFKYMFLDFSILKCICL